VEPPEASVRADGHADYAVYVSARVSQADVFTLYNQVDFGRRESATQFAK
jgi:hypothetical protein